MKLTAQFAMLVIAFTGPAYAFEPCGAGTVSTGKTYSISGTDILVRTGPGAKFPKIINQKATAIFGETHYITLDNSVTVKENCRSNGWSQVEVVDPNYFSASHRGWIETKALRQQQVSADGKRVFTEEDFIWDKVTRPYKDIIVKGVTRSTSH